VDTSKTKAAEVTGAAQDYSKQAGDKAADTYAAAKGNTEQVRLIFFSALFVNFWWLFNICSLELSVSESAFC